MAAWPPVELAPITDRMVEWDAWLSGDRARLELNGSTGTLTSTVTHEPYSKVARLWRRFWGAPEGSQGSAPKIKVHVPLAADIARASADLLFADPPEITSEDSVTADRLTEHLGAGLINVCASAAEICAGLGGVYLRVNWDVAERRAFLTKVDADAAVPTFRFGKLTSVTFWRVARVEGNTVWRHLETHELSAVGVGVIRHELYQGSQRDLGTITPLTEAVSGIALDDDGLVSSLSPGLTAVYIPNATPNTLWRSHPVGANLGLPDIAGSEDLHDRLDHTNSALMREVDLAKARLTVPAQFLDVQAAGKGATFDGDREVWSPLNIPLSQGQAQPRPELFQPALRVDEHLRVMQQITEDALRHAGYSASTFGEDEDSQAATATEVTSRDRRSALTRARKLRHWQPGLLAAVRKLLAVEAALGYAAVDPDGVTVTFPEAARSTPLENAQTLQLLDAAGAVSLQRKVEIANPGWNEQQVTEEMDRIREDRPAATDPEQFGFGGAGVVTEPTQTDVPEE